MIVYQQNYCIYGHHPSSSFYLEHNISEAEFYLHLLVEPTQLGPIFKVGYYLQTPAPTQDRLYKSSTAQTICKS
jgi:hypothetical protein